MDHVWGIHWHWAFWDHDHAIMCQNIFTCCLLGWWILCEEMACFCKNAGVTTKVMLVKSEKGCCSENCGLCQKQKCHCHTVVIMLDPLECKQTIKPPLAVLKLVFYSQWCDIFLCLHFATNSFPFCEMTRRSGISGGGFGSIQNGTSQAKVGVQKIMSEYGCKHLCALHVVGSWQVAAHSCGFCLSFVLATQTSGRCDVDGCGEIFPESLLWQLVFGIFTDASPCTEQKLGPWWIDESCNIGSHNGRLQHLLFQNRINDKIAKLTA